jgi:hypothetical protein
MGEPIYIVPPPPPRPRYYQIGSAALGLAAVGAGVFGSDGALLILCGASVVANVLSLALEGNKVMRSFETQAERTARLGPG